MKALLVFSEREPLLVVARRPVIGDGRLVEELARRGVTKFIAHEVPLEKLRAGYGAPFAVIEKELKSGRIARVLDYDGKRIFETLSVDDLGASFSYDPERCERPFGGGDRACSAWGRRRPRRNSTWCRVEGP